MTTLPRALRSSDAICERSSESDAKAAYTLSRDQPIPKLWPLQIDAETEFLISDRAEMYGTSDLETEPKHVVSRPILDGTSDLETGPKLVSLNGCQTDAELSRRSLRPKLWPRDRTCE